MIDWIRSWQGIGGPWAVFGASQWQHPVVLALAAAGGIWLISFVLVAANTAIVIALTAARLAGRAIGAAARWRWPSRPVRPPSRSPRTSTPCRRPGTSRSTLVQPGLANGPQRLLDREIRLTAQTGHAGRGRAPTWSSGARAASATTWTADHAILHRLAAAVRLDRHAAAGQPGRGEPRGRQVQGRGADRASAASRSRTPRPGWCRSASTYRSGRRSAGCPRSARRRRRTWSPGTAPRAARRSAGRPAAALRGADLLRVLVPRHVARSTPTTARRCSSTRPRIRPSRAAGRPSSTPRSPRCAPPRPAGRPCRPR